MLMKRLASALVTPSYEDAGLFKAELCSLNVALLPGVRRNARQDYIFDAMIDRTYRVPLVFAGRRAFFAAEVAEATALLENGAPPSEADDTVTQVAGRRALALRVEGAWRSLVNEDARGFARVTHQFIAAVWTIGTAAGRPMCFGAPPVR